MSGGDIAALVEHAKSDVQYIDGLQAHIDNDGTYNGRNVADLMAMVLWNATHLIDTATALTDLQARLEAAEAQNAKLREEVDQLRNGPLHRLCEALNEPRATLGGEHG